MCAAAVLQGKRAAPDAAEWAAHRAELRQQLTPESDLMQRIAGYKQSAAVQDEVSLHAAYQMLSELLLR
jgi:hypothetical protein